MSYLENYSLKKLDFTRFLKESKSISNIKCDNLQNAGGGL